VRHTFRRGRPGGGTSARGMGREEDLAGRMWRKFLDHLTDALGAPPPSVFAKGTWMHSKPDP